MKKLTIILLLTLVISDLQSQYYIDKAGLKFFENGTELLESGDYINADSVLSIALCSYRNENVYFNRALSRIMQFDTIGFCDDIEKAVFKYFDSESSALYNQFCCNNVDSIYYNKEFIPVHNDTNYRYFEEIRHPKYRKQTFGVIHDKESEGISMIVDYGCDEKLIGIDERKTDIIAYYKVKNDRKYYYFCTKNSNINSKLNFVRFNQKATRLLNNKYGVLKTTNNVDKLLISFELTISKSGYIADLSIEGTIPDIQLTDYKSLIENDLLYIIRKDTRFIPAEFESQKVNFVSYRILAY